MKTKHITLALLIICGISPLLADSQINHTTTNLQLFPKVVQAGSNFLFTWCDNRPTTSDCEFEIFSTATNSNLSNSGFSDYELSVPTGGRAGHRLHTEIVPSIRSITNDTGAIVAWVNHNDQKVYTMRITHSGNSDWFNLVQVHDASFMTPPQMCSDGVGGAYFAWVEKDGDDYDLNVKRITSSGGEGFSAQTIATSSKPITLPRICLANSDTAKVAWVEPDMSVIRRIDTTWKDEDKTVIDKIDTVFGTWWVKLSGVNSNGDVQDTVDVDSTNYLWANPIYSYYWTGLNIARGDGYTIVAMRHQYTTFADPPKYRAYKTEELYVRRVLDNGSKSSRVTLDYYDYPGDFYERPLYTRECFSCRSTPVIAASSDSGAYLAWESGSWNDGLGEKSSNSDINVAKINSSDSVVLNSIISSLGNTSNRAPQIICDGSNALVVWQSMDREGTESELHKCKITGTTVGSADTISSDAFSFDLIPAGDTTAVVTWNEQSGSDWDIYAEKITY